ncbi:phosphatidylinositol mannoside acyltransferase [Marinitenerispora sediminis]|uniref:Phosphatidylinositol mannoside acyltransferase n=1 Tax=Marinitenerispora sediminis TaxID=1931232 RepID=A0A368TAQ8_9ACTN|nr:phosphatidylinositol mannoside acyltransferase [Marinitenerispora sediminis]RCV51036.1 phosphatidylinositol mannoside acyltransferase [Marinitenerispora sediminis]RCV57029.1 phosphatidylinositol mannoside acyltransferase [Marinitenerispora sediminis]RCV60007.1 phosphatidylinositol mannoside acyltransferase [Marinitenerispora sediminis]
MAERLAAAAFGAGWALARRVPEPVGRWTFTRIADFAWRRRTAGVRRLEANLRRVVGADVPPERLRALSRAGMRSYLRYWYEAFRMPAMDRATILDRTRCTGIEALEAHLAAGRGVVAALPHMGNWDHAGAWIALRGSSPTTVAERLRPERLFERFTAFRAGLGIEVLPLTGGEHSTAGRLARRLRAGGLVCLLADRDLTATGVEVTLFGEPARLPAGPAALAERTGAALMPVSLWYDGPYLRIRVHEEILAPDVPERPARVRAMTQRLAEVFEEAIAAHPQDWHMLQRVFAADLGEYRRPPPSPDNLG